ncbi:MAG: TolC family protein [Oligoflexia bacterium]|nr:TolC family protein [Oligoflexia bacterium]
MKSFPLVLALLFLPGPSRAETSRASLELKEAEQKALERSPRLAASRAEAQAAREQADAAGSALFPRLTLEANYRYVSEIPRLAVGPTGLSFGAHDNVSIGPQLSYSLWDGGTARAGWNSVRKLSEAREEDLRQARLQVRLAARAAYFRVQLGCQELKLVSESLKLAESQERDIRNRFKAGAASRVDTLAAHREALSLQMKYRQARAELASSLRELAAIIDEALPAPDVLVVDSQAKSLQELSPSEPRALSANHPQLQAQLRLSEAQTLAADGHRGERWPRILLTGKSSYDTPNGPIQEWVWQNTAGVSLSLPLFEASRAASLASQKSAEALAAEKRAEQLRTDLERDWAKARLQLESAREQRELSQAAAREAAEIAELIYASYKAGRTNFLDVQSANNRVLEARVQLARIQAQILTETARLESFAAQD